MGSASSKAAKGAATGAAKRQYPKRVPQSGGQSSPGRSVHPKPQASSSRDEGSSLRSLERSSCTKQRFIPNAVIDLDARDPDFARSLRSIGPVNPSPTMSNSSAFRPSPESNSPALAGTKRPIFPAPSSNPALQVLAARERLARRASEELIYAGREGHGGKEFLDVLTVKRILKMRDGEENGGNGVADQEIERALGLKGGLVKKLGKRNLVFAVVD